MANQLWAALVVTFSENGLDRGAVSGQVTESRCLSFAFSGERYLKLYVETSGLDFVVDVESFVVLMV